MRKNIFQVIYTVLMGLSIYSCSELILPKQVGVKGTVSLPIRVGAANLASMLKDKIVKTFSDDEDEPEGTKKNTKVYSVDYNGQTVQTFCIYIPIEMTESLNPNNFLKTMDAQINGSISADPKEIYVSPIPYPGVYTGGLIPITVIKELMDINIPPYFSLDSISGYVRSIDFGTNQEDIVLGKGKIGMNFNFTKIPPGLQMTLKCEEIDTVTGVPTRILFSTTKPLEEGDNILGNEEPKTLTVSEYQEDKKVLKFTVVLESIDTDHPELWNPASHGFTENTVEIKGNINIIRKWTRAEIDLAKALKASAAIDDTFGKFPANSFDLSELKKYFNGGFKFSDDLEVKIYMDGPDPEVIDYMGSRLLLKAQYNNKTGSDGEKLYYDTLSISKNPINIDNHLVKKGDEEFYNDKNLPGNYCTIDEEVIADIFRTMPDDLFFIFTIEVEAGKYLIIKPDVFNDTDDSGSIKTTMMIMLPMTLIAEVDGDKKSTISLPEMFGNDDLFGREEPEDLFSEANVEYIRMTIDFSDQIFTNGCLFINEKKELFHQGIQLNGKKLVLNFNDEQVKEIQRNLIKPDIKIEFDNGGMISVPKNMAVINITFEMKGIINIGELLE